MNFDLLFQQAVTLLAAGDLPALDRLLTDHPELARQPLTTPAPWLREKIGNALDGFFKNPYLLWFIAEDVPVLGTLPPNIPDLARTILLHAQGSPDLQHQLDTTFRLVCWSVPARNADHQLELLDLLLTAGASTGGSLDNALVNANIQAAQHLADHGVPLTLSSALCLNRWEDATKLVSSADSDAKQFALVLAALNGNHAAVQWNLHHGADPNLPSKNLYSHGTPLHHAVCSGSLPAVRTLLDAGANPHTRDTAWNGTPLGWSEHYLSERKDPASQKTYTEIASCLRDALRST